MVYTTRLYFDDYKNYIAALHVVYSILVLRYHNEDEYIRGGYGIGAAPIQSIDSLKDIIPLVTTSRGG
jgi:hypothetical protein